MFSSDCPSNGGDFYLRKVSRVISWSKGEQRYLLSRVPTDWKWKRTRCESYECVTYSLESVDFWEILEGLEACHVELDGFEVLELLKECLILL